MLDFYECCFRANKEMERVLFYFWYLIGLFGGNAGEFGVAFFD
jgi:hypothetical protein